MKKELMMSALIALYAHDVYSQDKLKQEEKSWLESFGSKVVNVVEGAVKSGVDYVDSKAYESKLEDQIEQRICYTVPDNEAAGLLSYLGLKQGISADIIDVKEKTATANVYFHYDLDNLAFAQQYEFSLKDKSIDKLATKGNSWIDIDGKGYPQKEGTRILHLYDEVIRQWDYYKNKHEKENQGETFYYERNSIDVDGNKALAGITYFVLDKFSNKKQGKEQTVKQEWTYSAGKWKFFDNDMFLQEKNKKAIEKGFLEDAKEKVIEGYNKFKKIWRGG